MRCQFQTIAWNDPHQPFGVTVECGAPATHRIDIAIAGANPHAPGGELGNRSHYCCGHRRDILAEIDEHAAIVVRNDVVQDASVRTEIAGEDGAWRMRLHVKHHGQTEQATPWMRLVAHTRGGAELEAAARSAVIQSNVIGDHR